LNNFLVPSESEHCEDFESFLECNSFIPFSKFQI